MAEWEIRAHPDLLKDLEKLGGRELQNFYAKKEKIKANRCAKSICAEAPIAIGNRSPTTFGWCTMSGARQCGCSPSAPTRRRLKHT